MIVSGSIMLYTEGLLPNDDILVECGELVALAEAVRKLEAAAEAAEDFRKSTTAEDWVKLNDALDTLAEQENLTTPSE